MNRLYRSTKDKKLFGVCGGLAEATGIDATVIRVVLIVTAAFSGGAPIPIYLIAAAIMPKDPTYHPHSGSSYGSYGNSNWGRTTPQQHWGSTPPPPPPPPQPPNFGQTAQGYYPPNEAAKTPSIDDLMEDIEKKAMAREIEELKRKLEKLEQDSNKQNKGDD